MAPRKGSGELTLVEKVAVVKYAEVHSERQTANFFGISKTSVNYMKRNKHVFMYVLEANKEMDFNRCRRFRYTDNLNINDQTLEWAQQMMENGEPITAKLIKEKALSYAHDAGVLNFSASNGWLDSFKRRFGINLSSAKPAESSQNTKVTKEVWKRILPHQIKEDIVALMSNSRNKRKVPKKRKNKRLEKLRRQRQIDLIF